MTAVVAPVRERPILFSGPMVRAILDGQKSQTRRVMKLQPSEKATHVEWNTVASAFVPWRLGASTPSSGHRIGTKVFRCPYGNVGDRLWVREAAWYDREIIPVLGYRRAFFAGTSDMRKENASGGETAYSNFTNHAEVLDLNASLVKRPSIHMWRWASRITLEITDVRVERLHGISEDDAKAEGVEPNVILASLGRNIGLQQHQSAFLNTWDHLNKARGFGWDMNPWVWVLSFRRITP